MSDSEPIAFIGRRGAQAAAAETSQSHPKRTSHPIHFDRRELSEILSVYGRMVAAGEWRDYAIDATKEKAVFSVFRRTSEAPLYRIEKTPKNARRQGAYSVVAPTGLILKRGHELRHVLRVIDRKLQLVDA